MNIDEMLDRCKEKLGVTSDYALAKELEIRPVRISAYRQGREHPDTYVCFRMAEILGESPSSVVAQVEAVTQKNPRKAMFFQRFFMIAALWITLGLVSALSDGSYGSAFAAGNNAETRANTTYSPIMRSIKNLFLRLRRRLKMLIFERYFTCNWHVKPFGLVM